MKAEQRKMGSILFICIIGFCLAIMVAGSNLNLDKKLRIRKV